MNEPNVEPVDHEPIGSPEVDFAAFQRLYDEHATLVFSMARRMTADSAAAEAITQAVFVRLWAARGVVGTADAARWLSRTTRRESLLRARAHGPARDIADPAIDDGLPPYHRSGMPRSSATPTHVSVAVAMRRLRRDQFEAIESGFFHGSTCEEIALARTLPPKTVKRNIRSGLHHLLRILDEPKTAI